MKDRSPTFLQRIANILTTALLMVACVAGVIFATFLAAPELFPELNTSPQSAQPELAVIDLPTLASAVQIPTLTNTPIPAVLATNTPSPTETFVAPTASPTKQATNTPTPAPELEGVELVPPTLTPTPTHTPTWTPTPRGPTATPTNTPSAFPFTRTTDSPIYLRNYANSAGCDWAGIAGEVLDVSGNPVATGLYRIHIWDGGVDVRIDTSSKRDYGPSGWEQFILDRPVERFYNLQLETVNQTPVSEVYRVQTANDCNRNLLYFIFLQNR